MVGWVEQQRNPTLLMLCFYISYNRFRSPQPPDIRCLLATKADVHIQSLGKIERGKTTKLNHKTMCGLAYALQIPSEYLDSVVKNIPVQDNIIIKFCPSCWSPGTPLETIWTNYPLSVLFSLWN